MDRLDTEIWLKKAAQARKKWNAAQRQFRAEYDRAMTVLLHEAARNYLSVEDIAKITDLSKNEVRAKMRKAGLEPRIGKRMLSAHAARALRENAELLGITPAQMDLTSPLAYLPMGEKLRKELESKTAPSVTELPEVSENSVFILLSWDNPEGGLYERTCASEQEAKDYGFTKIQEGKGTPVWEGRTCRNPDAPYGTRHLSIVQVTL